MFSRSIQKGKHVRIVGADCKYARGSIFNRPLRMPRLRMPHVTKRTLRLAAAAALAVALTCAGSYGAWAAGLAQSNYKWFTDNPTAKTFTLKTPGDVYSFAEIVNGTSPKPIQNIVNETYGSTAYNFWGKTVQIATGTNPEISEKPAEDQTGQAGTLPLNALGTHYEFEPIGTAANPFCGTFEGNGATLLNLLIDDNAPIIKNATQTQPGINNIGLFGYIGEGGSARNFTVTGSINIGTTAAGNPEAPATQNSTKPLNNIGGAVGTSKGELKNITSSIKLNIQANAPAYEGEFGPTPAINNIGGVVGRTYKSISNLTYSGTLTLNSQSSSLMERGNPTPVARSIGGVAGSLGGYDRTGKTTYTHVSGATATKCTNSGTIQLSFTGMAKDSWNTDVNCKPAEIGGIAGTSTGSIFDCANTGSLLTSTKSATGKAPLYDITNDNGGSAVGGIVGNLRHTGIVSGEGTDGGSAQDKLVIQRCYNTGLIQGSNSLGGIAGTAGTYTLITECANGNALAQNSNRQQDVDTTPEAQGAIICTQWNKPISAGIVGGTLGSVSYCENRGVVNTTQAGYYIAGIVGHLGYSLTGDKLDPYKNDPSYTAEVYGCINIGQIAPGHPTRQRFGALVGQNDGYVHDSVVRYGSVTIGQNAGENKGGSYPIGGDVEGRVERITTLTNAELKTTAPADTLNNGAFSNGTYTFYWFSGYGSSNPDANNNINYNDGYPVLTTWAKPQNGIQLDKNRLQQLSVKDALYTEADSEPAPLVQLSFMQDSGAWIELKQNADYLIIPQKEAFARTDNTASPQPYKYTIRGIGRYTGDVLDFANYGITAGTFDDMTVVVDSTKKFNWHVQFPESVQVVDRANKPLDAGKYSWVIYDSGTNNITSPAAPKFPVFASDGYIVFNNDGKYIAALDAIKRVNDPTKWTSFIVYDNQKKKISDSEGMVYDKYGNAISGTSVTHTWLDWSGTSTTKNCWVGYSSMGYKEAVTNAENSHNGEAGYVVEIIGKGSFESTSKVGRYIINTASIDADSEVTLTLDDGCIYKYDAEISKFYTLKNKNQPNTTANRDYELYTTTFAAKPIEATATVKYLNKELEQVKINNIGGFSNYGKDDLRYNCSLRFGGFEVSDYIYTYTPDWLRNRNATISNTGYGAAIQVNSYPTLFQNGQYDFKVNAFSGYVSMNFNIAKANASAVNVACAKQAALPNSKTDNVADSIANPVTLKINNNSQDTLREGLDYKLSYLRSDGTALSKAPNELGTYKVKVELLPLNFVGTLNLGEYAFEVVATKTFEVSTTPDISSIKGNYIASTEWNPGKITPSIDFKDPTSGNSLSLEYGKDYSIVVMDVYNHASTDDVINMPYDAESSNLDNMYPYIYGFDLALVNTANISGLPLYVKVIGRGLYAGCTQEVLWQLTPWDLSSTEQSKWRIDLEPPTHTLSPVTHIVDKFPYGKIYYDDQIIYSHESGGYRYQFFELTSNPEIVVAGQNVHWVLDSGMYDLVTDAIELSENLKVQPYNIGKSLSYEIIDGDKLTYCGTLFKPEIKNKTYNLVSGTDFKVLEYRNNLEAGQATALVNGIGNFTGTREVPFVIKQRPLTSTGISIASIPQQRFTGEAITPSLTITDTGLAPGHDASRENLVQGKDYEVEFINNENIGKAQINIKGIGNYSGTISTQFEIIPNPNAVSYYVECVDVLNTTRYVAPTSRVDGGKGADVITVSAPAIQNYTAIEPQKTITLDALKKNIVRFEYLHNDAHLPEPAEGVGVSITQYKNNPLWYAFARAKVMPTGANQDVTWTTSDTTIAGITEKGFIAAYKDGVVNITATPISASDKTGSQKLAIVGMNEEAPSSKETDSATKIEVEGVPSGSKLSTSKVDIPNVSVGKDIELISEGAYEISLYALSDNTVEVQPNGTLKITLPIPENADLTKLALYHWDDALDGASATTYTKEAFEITSDAKFAIFETDHLSLFTFVIDNAAAPSMPPTKPNIPGVDNTGGNNGSSGNSDNGGNNSGATNNGTGNTTGVNFGTTIGGSPLNNAPATVNPAALTATPDATAPEVADAATSLGQGDDAASALAKNDIAQGGAANTPGKDGALESPGNLIDSILAFNWSLIAVILLLIAACGVGIGYFVRQHKIENSYID